MEPTEPRSSTIGPSLDQNTLDSLQFNEEIQHSLTVLTENANSFTSLLDLPAPQAVELLPHYPESNDPAPSLTVTADAHHTLYHFNPGANLTFPSNLALIEPPAMFSVFAGEHHQNYHNNNNDDDHDINSYININNTNNYSPETTGTVPSNSSGNLGKEKNKPAELDSNNNNDNPNSSRPLDISSEKHNQNQRSAKRKEREKRAKAATKKSKSGVNDSSEDAEVLPFVHVRARRGEATDSHSLAERARREKINARMKLLQELVPGCNKISGMALVLDEIINHVQLLQHQVEFLSMRLRAVNPGTDFNRDSILTAESGSLMENNFPSIATPVMLPEVQVTGNGQQYQQQWHVDGHQQQPVWGREEESFNFVTPENSLLSTTLQQIQ